ncbi:MAG TPA: hypothetical protein PK886_02790, partial [Candidatus Paceibacterota bacterium]|nr:hypothetical protein [Candidatus Paceibacterota bacterium]
IIVTSESKNASGSRAYFVQICDWSDSTNVNNTADTECTGGGWRTLNYPYGTGFTNNTDTTTTFEVYNGYFYTGSSPGTTINTPLTNFVSNNTILVRYYSTVNSTVNLDIDRLQIELGYDSQYYPYTFSKNGSYSGTTSNFYTTVRNTDNARMSMTNQAGAAMDIDYSFRGIETFPGANTIFVSCECGYVSATTMTYNVAIYNYTTPGWEDLHSGQITASGASADQFNYFAKNNTTLSNYISNGEASIRVYSTATGTQTFQIDQLYIVVGATTSGTTGSEVSYGDDNTTTATDTQTVDALSATDTTGADWEVATCLNTTAPCAQNPYSTDRVGTIGTNHAAAYNLTIDAGEPTHSSITALRLISRHRSNSTTMTVQTSILDTSGHTSGQTISGSWTTVGATSASTSYVLGNTLLQANPEDHLYHDIDKVKVRIKTTVSTQITSVTVNWDFAMVAFRWVNDQNYRGTLTSQYIPTNGGLVLGTAVAVSATNMATWRGTLTTDNVFWSNLGTTTGLNVYLDVGNMNINNANKMIITSEQKNVTTARTYFLQICDWVSSTGVSHSADTECTGGGWRTLQIPTSGSSETTDTVRTIEIWNGYFQTGSNPGSPIDTPLTNFVNNGTARIRYYSTTNSTAQFDIDRLAIELGIDPVYYPTSYTKQNSWTGNFANAINYTALSDNNRVTLTNQTPNPMDGYFEFNDIQPYSDANTILVYLEGAYISSSIMTYNLAIYNYTTPGWEDLHSGQITASGSNVEQLNYFAKNNVTLSNYISGGKARVRIYSTVAGTQTFSIDQFYIVVGSVNTSTSLSETSFGDDNATDASNTRDIDVLTTSTGGNTWQVATCLNNTSPCATTPYATDWAGTWGTHYSASQNVSMPVTVPNNTAVTGVYYAARFRSNVTTNTIALGLKDFSGQFAPGTTSVTGGWSTIGTTNALTTYTFTNGLWPVNPEDHVDLDNNLVSLRLRTSGSTATSTTTRDWDFAFTSIRYMYLPAVPTVSFSISDNTIGFGTLSSSSARFATGDGTGSATEVEAHTITASTNLKNGYTILVDGGTLTNGADTISAIGDTNTASSVGTSQFGFRVTASDGIGVVSSPYASSGFAFDTGSLPDQIASATYGDGETTTYSVRYIANIPTIQPSGSYSSTLTYTLVPNF